MISAGKMRKNHHVYLVQTWTHSARKPDVG